MSSLVHLFGVEPRQPAFVSSRYPISVSLLIAAADWFFELYVGLFATVPCVAPHGQPVSAV